MKKVYSKPTVQQYHPIQPAQMLAQSSTFIPIGGEVDEFNVKEQRDYSDGKSSQHGAWDNEW